MKFVTHCFNFAVFGMNYQKITRKILATHLALRKPQEVLLYSPICQIMETLCKSCQDCYHILVSQDNASVYQCRRQIHLTT